jgi:hypothetical protein
MLDKGNATEDLADTRTITSDYRTCDSPWIGYSTQPFAPCSQSDGVSVMGRGVLAYLMASQVFLALAGCASPVRVGIETAGGETNYSTDLEHDYGIVTPGSRLSHTFTVVNPSNESWKLASVEKTCSCAILRATKLIIAPGESQSFELDYQAPNKCRDDRQSVKLHFEGAGEPTITLTVKSKPRFPLTILPAELSFGEVATGTKETRTLRIENYSKSSWQGLAVEDIPPYLKLLRLDKINEAGDALPREVWVAEFQFDASGQEACTHEGTVSIRRRGTESERVEGAIPVRATVTDGISVAPSVVNFGKIGRGEAGEAKVMIRVNGGHKRTFSPADVRTRSEGGHDIRMAWKAITNECWVMTLTIKPAAHPGTIVGGKLAIVFPDGIAEKTIKYTAWMKTD